MLKYIEYRQQVRPHIFVVENELKLFNLSKVILDGGWVFDEETVD